MLYIFYILYAYVTHVTYRIFTSAWPKDSQRVKHISNTYWPPLPLQMPWRTVLEAEQGRTAFAGHSVRVKLIKEIGSQSCEDAYLPSG